MILRADESRMADAVSLALKLWSGHSEKELTEELSPLAEGLTATSNYLSQRTV